MIPDDVVDHVREAADIVGIIGEHVNLRRVGADWRGPCPFHQGTRRNFSVSPRKRMYYCFVCHEGGDVFNFLQKRLGMDWPSAVRLVAEKSGVEVREVETRREGPDPRTPLWEVNAAAAEYFARFLWQDPSAQPAREYLAQRHVTRESTERFGIGYAPREIGLMRSYLNTLGFDDARLFEAGLLVRREKSEEPRPRFRGRVIFPIHDATGRLAGFGGRLLGPGEPKYLNSAESATFSKGRMLYGLYAAKQAVRRADRLLVVEGYFDVLRLVLAGVEEVVAPLGTALTSDQSALVTRYTKNVFLLYDSDKAGLKATFVAGDRLLEHGASVRVVTLPEGEDPDTFVDRHGRAALERQIEDAMDVFDRKVQLLERNGWFAEVSRRRRAIDRLLPTLRATTDAVMRDIYISRASEVSGVSAETLRREVAASPRQRSPESQPAARERPSAPPPSEPAPARARPLAEPTGFERELARALLQRPAAAEMFFEREEIDVREFADARIREILEAIRDVGPEATVALLAPRLSAPSIALLERLAAEPGAIMNSERTISEGVNRLIARALRRRAARVQKQLEVARGDEEDALLAEKDALQKQLRGLSVQDWSGVWKGK